MKQKSVQSYNILVNNSKRNHALNFYIYAMNFYTIISLFIKSKYMELYKISYIYNLS